VKNNTLWLKVACVLSVAQVINTCSVSQDCSTSCSDTPCSSSKNTWFPRAFSSDSSREITLEKTVFQTDSARDEWNGTFSFATQYMQNFGSKCEASCKNLGSMFAWGAAGTNEMTVGNNSGAADIDAWNFGVGNVQGGTIGSLGYDPTAIGGTLTLNPKITQVGTDFMLYFVHKKDERGMYFKVHAPLGAISVNPQIADTSEKIDVNYFSQTTTAGTAAAAAITYNTAYYSLANRSENVASALAGGVGSGNSLAGNNNIYKLNLLYGKVSDCKRTEIRLADLSFVLGYNVVAKQPALQAMFQQLSMHLNQFLVAVAFGALVLT
jgi:hypothetical protein